MDGDTQTPWGHEQWATWGAYEVSDHGRMRVMTGSNAGPAGRLLVPYLNNGTAMYSTRNERKSGMTPRTVQKIMREAWGVKGFALTPAQVDVIRAESIRHNEALFPGVATTCAQRKKFIEQNFNKPPVDHECRFATMRTNCQGFQSWDCAEMDPMTNHMEPGVWVSIAPQQQQEEAA